MLELEFITKDIQKERIRQAEAYRLIQEWRRSIRKQRPISYKFLADIGRRISSMGDRLQYKFSDADSSKIRVAPNRRYSHGSTPRIDPLICREDSAARENRNHLFKEHARIADCLHR